MCSGSVSGGARCCCWLTASIAVMTGAFRITQWLLGLGMLFSLFKGFDWESALLLGGFLLVITPCRPLFLSQGLPAPRPVHPLLADVGGGPCCWEPCGCCSSPIGRWSMTPPSGCTSRPTGPGRLPRPACHGERHRCAGGGRGSPSAGPFAPRHRQAGCRGALPCPWAGDAGRGRPRLPGPAGDRSLCSTQAARPS